MTPNLIIDSEWFGLGIFSIIIVVSIAMNYICNWLEKKFYTRKPERW